MFSSQEKQIAKRLLLLGVAPQNAGYQYLLTAVRMVLEDQTALLGISKGLYQQIAEEYHTKWQNVERCLRTAIKNAWQSCPPELWQDYFGIYPSKAPSNSNFIARLSQQIEIEESA